MNGDKEVVLPTLKGAALSTRTDILVGTVHGNSAATGPLPDGSDLAGGSISWQEVLASVDEAWSDVPSTSNLHVKTGCRWMEDPRYFEDCEIVSLGDHARSHLLARGELSIKGDYAFVDDFIVQYGVDDPTTADWLGEISAGDALVHVYYLNWHFGYKERPQAYVRAVLMLYHTAFRHESLVSLMNNQLAQRDEHMQALFGYIEHTVSFNSKWILREPDWRVPHMWSRNVRKHMRLQLSAVSTPAASPEPLRPSGVPTLSNIIAQSGLPNKAQRRELRKEHFVAVGLARLRGEYKSLPKHARKMKKMMMQSRKMSMRFESDDSDIGLMLAEAESKEAEQAFYDALARLSFSDEPAIQPQGYFTGENVGKAVGVALAGTAAVGLTIAVNRAYRSWLVAQERVEELRASVVSMTQEIAATTASVRQHVDSVGPAVSSSVSQLDSLVTQLKTAFDGMVNSMRSALSCFGNGTLWKVGVTMVTLFVLTTAGKAVALFASALLSMLEAVLGSAWSAVSEVFRQAVSANTDVQVQSGAGSLFAKAFAAIFLATAFKDGARWQDTLMRRISYFGRTSEGVDDFVSWLKMAAQSCVNWALSFFSEHRVDWVSKGEKPLMDAGALVDRLDQLMLVEGGGTERVDACLDALRTLSGLREIYRGLPAEKQVQALYVRAAAHLNTVAGGKESRNNFRQEPVMVVLRGKAGVGKTALSMPFVCAVLAASGQFGENPQPDKIISQVWSRSTSEYWNGYVGQKAIVIDDLFQTVQDHNNTDNDYINIIRTIGSFALPLNMADLTSKGREYFRSELVFATTNVDNIGGFANCVVDESAVLRRMKYVYDLRVKEEYAQEDGKLDVVLFSEELEKAKQRKGFTNAYPWHIWEARTWNLSTTAGANRAGAQWIGLDALILKIAADIRANKMLHESARTSVEHLLNNFDESEDMLAQSGSEGSAASAVGTDTPLLDPGGDDEEVVREEASAGSPSDTQTSYERFRENWERMQREMGFEPMDPTPPWEGFIGPQPRAVWPHPMGLHDSSARGQSVAELVEASRACLVGRLPDILKMAGWAMALGGACYIAYKLLRALVKAVVGAVAGALGFNKEKQGKWTHQSGRPLHPTRAQSLSARNVHVQSLDNKVANLVYSDTYKAYVETPDGQIKAILGQVMAVQGHVMLQPAHFTDSVRNSTQPGDRLVLRNAVNPSHIIPFQVSDYLAFKRFRRDKTDVEFFLVPYTVRSFRRKAKFFVSERNIEDLAGQRVRLDVTSIGTPQELSPSNQRWVHMSTVGIERNMRYLGYQHKRGWRYEAPTEVGDCGAPLMLVSPLGPEVVLGIHTALDVGRHRAFAPVVTREYVEEAVRKLESGVICGGIEDDIDAEMEVQAGRFGLGYEPTDNVHLKPGNAPAPEHYTGSGSFMPLFLLDKGPVFSPNSKFFPTKLYGAWGSCPVKPAHLRPFERDGELRFPMLEAYQPYMSGLRHVDYEWLDMAVHDAMKPFYEATVNHTRRIFSFEEAVGGIPALDFKSLPRGTSAGFPWTLKYKHGKRDMFGFDGDYLFDTPGAREVRARVEEIVQAASEGRRLLHLCSDFPKDELRPIEKVDAGKTRMISGTAVDYSIVCRMYFGAFVAALNSTHSASGLCPGICVYSDWAHLQSFITNKGDKVFDGDFKGFDASQQPGVLLRFLRYINRWYADGNDKIREVLFLDLINSRHMCGRGSDQRWLVQWTKGMPSGHFLTSTINSMYSMTVLASAFGSLTGMWGQFWQHVRAATLGDDNLVNPSDAVVGVFNQVTVAEFVKEKFHMEYTAGRKGEALVPYLNIRDVTFLCRSFTVEEGSVACPLKLESFLYTAYYCKNRLLESHILPENLEFALEELAMHSQDVWNQYAPRIVSTLMERFGRDTRVPPDKSSYLRLVRSRTDNGW